jgi:RNA polymerase sigma-70 factor (ECF subfamily)
MAAMASDLEERIAKCLDRGDFRQAATDALEGYGPQIYGFLLAVMKDDESADEAFAEFSEDLWRGIGQFRRESSFRTWAYQLAWNAARQLARDPYKRRGRRLRTSQWSGIAEQIRSSTATREAALQARLAKIRDALDPEEQTLLVLRVDRELSWREVAQVMSEPGNELDEAAVRKRFQRLKAKLQELAKRIR